MDESTERSVELAARKARNSDGTVSHCTVSELLAQQASVSPRREEGPKRSDGVITPSGGREERTEEE